MNKLSAGLLLIAMAAAGEDARQIVAESQNRSRSKSLEYAGTLEVISASSSQAGVKHWTFQRIGSFGGSKAILRFTAPAEIKGVALLIVSHPDRASDQWMYTPAIGRSRPIAVQNRGTGLFGTGYSFEDLEERDVDQFKYKLAGNVSVDGAASWKIESRPKESKSSQYDLSVLSIRKDNYVVVQIENYHEQRLIRTIHSSDLHKIDGIWTAGRIEIEDAARKIRTVLRLENVRYNLPLKEADFRPEALK
jgi:Outer membrane lipoprotein-sorting protein